ncbi:nuclear transport factor 2 family protein [Thalassobius sp. Cn5-15]|uniref:nuclear transport factor 2 family protein n=1 Tax=Thalassobius sp. Cn5-15 TaxID=2917763 RepID=UPI001EF1C94D|nr:nuclear transport factor 2 family protein [Thalassobius sp. Cn5-15]MCG7493618.1 nuclear transport factor 2 family protein [Thalassobius sp. Cn5-15]
MTHPLDQFFAAWRKDDADAQGSAQRAALSAVLSPNCTYADPNTPAPLVGAEAVIDYVSMFSIQMPGAAARVLTVDTHHGFARATVDFINNETVLMRGQYFAELEGGTLSRLVGFTGMGDNQ